MYAEHARSRRDKMRLTLLDTVLLGALTLAGLLGVDTLNTLLEVVLGWGALLGS